MFAHLTQYFGLARQRRQLAQLDAHQLADIGITQAEAAAESRRPVWDAPSHWTKRPGAPRAQLGQLRTA